jgi:hypothetical protein
VTVADGKFDAPYGAPTAGPPSYQPYEIRLTTVFGFVNDGELGPEQYPLAFLSLNRSRRRRGGRYCSQC